MLHGYINEIYAEGYSDRSLGDIDGSLEEIDGQNRLEGKRLYLYELSDKDVDSFIEGSKFNIVRVLRLLSGGSPTSDYEPTVVHVYQNCKIEKYAEKDNSSELARFCGRRAVKLTDVSIVYGRKIKGGLRVDKLETCEQLNHIMHQCLGIQIDCRDCGKTVLQQVTEYGFCPECWAVEENKKKIEDFKKELKKRKEEEAERYKKYTAPSKEPVLPIYDDKGNML